MNKEAILQIIDNTLESLKNARRNATDHSETSFLQGQQMALTELKLAILEKDHERR